MSEKLNDLTETIININNAVDSPKEENIGFKRINFFICVRK
jgi:hypothetical protein